MQFKKNKEKLKLFLILGKHLVNIQHIRSSHWHIESYAHHTYTKNDL